MHPRQLDKTIDDLILSNQHEKAKRILIDEYEKAKKSGDKDSIDAVLGHLVFLCAANDPPCLNEGRDFCSLREANKATAYNALQTGLFEYYSAGSYTNAMRKLREAKEKGEREGDSRTAYSALGHLGRAYLESGQLGEAAVAIRAIEQALFDQKAFVVGDETAFLEAARDKGLEPEAVRRIAAALSPLCHDPKFKRRLEHLASSQ